VKETHSDELPDEAELAKLPNVVLHVLGVETSSLPVERGRQVVRQPLAGVYSVYTGSELLRLGEDRLLGLHPEQVGVRGKCNSTMHSALSTTLVPVVALTSAGSVPVPVRHGLQTKLLLCDGDSLGV
jgi:hypothetical protein